MSLKTDSSSNDSSEDTIKTDSGSDMRVEEGTSSSTESYSNHAFTPLGSISTDPEDEIAANGSLPPSARASPAPQGLGPVPNGKPASPYNERSNPIGPNGSIAAQTVSSKDPKAAAQAASDMRNIVRRKLTGYVGFANLPNQWHRKSVRKGFNFNVMVVGKIQ